MRSYGRDVGFETNGKGLDKTVERVNLIMSR